MQLGLYHDRNVQVNTKTSSATSVPVRLAAIMRCAGQCYIMVLAVTVLIALAAKGRKEKESKELQQA